MQYSNDCSESNSSQNVSSLCTILELHYAMQIDAQMITSVCGLGYAVLNQ